MSVRYLAVVIISCVVAVLAAASAWGAVLYVKQDSPGPVFDGQSWETAFHSVQEAVNAVEDDFSEIWVAKGTYEENLVLERPTSLYGGFNGDETSSEHSDPLTNETILDGGGDGVVVEYLDTAIISPHVSGFTIRNGSGPEGAGITFGGEYLGYPRGSGVVSDCIITGNNSGTASVVYSSLRLLIRNCRITRNANAVGAVYAPGVDISNTTISDNDSAGVLYTESVIADRCTISDNRSGIRQMRDSETSYAHRMKITNCTISNNSGYDTLRRSAEGGAVFFQAETSSAADFDVILANNIITGNNAPDLVSAVRIQNASVNVVNNSIALNGIANEGAVSFEQCTGTVANNVVAFNTSGFEWNGGNLSLRNNCVYGNKRFNYRGGDDPTGTLGNISQDPVFASEIMGDLHVQPDSPCVDAGDDTAASIAYFDIDGHIRIWGEHADIGADESNGLVWPEKQRGVVYVSKQGSDDNDGSSWPKAKKTIQAGIDAAADTVAEVWVAAGTYNERIILQPKAWLYGGFSGDETERTQRHWRTHRVVIDGTPTADGEGGSVVTALSIPCDLSCLDGFTIRGGTGTSVPDENHSYMSWCWGGGIYCDNVAIPIVNNVITTNRAHYGGGIYCTHSGVLISSNRLTENEAYSDIFLSGAPPRGYGGAVYASAGAVIVAGNVITANSAADGSAVYCGGRVSIASNTIVDNFWTPAYVDFHGSTIYCPDSQPTITNNIMAHNAGGIYNAGTDSPLLENNCLFDNNYAYSGAVVVPEHSTDIVQDPGFASIEYGDLHIQPDSPCVDAGSESFELPVLCDMDGQPRVQGQKIDIGADESDGTTWSFSPIIIRVCPDGSDDNDGSSWEHAKRTVHAAAAALAGEGGDVWVRAGTYYTAGSSLGTLMVPNHVFLHGGFDGTETQRSQRNWARNATNLAGDKSAAGCYGSVVTIDAGSVRAAVDGFTIRDGNASEHGGGIYCGDSTRPVIANNRIINNSAGEPGASRYVSVGGGVCCSKGCSPTITGNIIAGNAAGMGAGVLINRGVLAGNTIVDNTGTDLRAEALCCSPDTLLVNNIVAFNNSCGISAGTSEPFLTYGNCVYGNTNDFCNISTIPNGDISADPLFVDRQAGDYHLLPTSPCLDGGNSSVWPLPELDIDGEQRVSFSAVDIGADECGSTPESLGQVKLLEPDAVVRCTGIVTLAEYGMFYMESPNRSSGVMVAKIDHGVAVGDSVLVRGSAYTSGFEKRIRATEVTVIGKGHIEPLCMTNKEVGGSDFFYDPTTRAGQLGVKDGIGPNNIGLLVRTTGRVVDSTSFCYIDDGSGVQDDPDNKGVLVFPRGISLTIGDYVSVTGISSIIYNYKNGAYQRRILVRDQDDIVVFEP